MSRMDGREYIASLRNTIDMDKHEITRLSATIKREQQYLESLGIPSDAPALGLSYSDMLVESAEIDARRIADAMLHLTPQPLIGLLPIEDFNAWATVAPNGDPICILDDGLFATLVTFSWCIGEATTSPKNRKVAPDYVKCSLASIAACERIVYGGFEPAEEYLSSLDFKVDEGGYT
jgi:hypothetical protein